MKPFNETNLTFLKQLKQNTSRPTVAFLKMAANISIKTFICIHL